MIEWQAPDGQNREFLGPQLCTLNTGSWGEYTDFHWKFNGVASGERISKKWSRFDEVSAVHWRSSFFSDTVQ